MWNRKKFLILIVFLNCIYFVGTSFLVTRHINNHNQSHLNRWIEAGSRAVLDILLLDINDRKVFAEEFKAMDLEKEIKDWAAAKNILNVVELTKKTAKSWVGLREKVPFDRKQIKYMEDVGFYKDPNYLNFNYFLDVDGRQFFITQQVDDMDLLLYLEVYGMGVTILEIDADKNAHTLFTTLPKHIADELMQKTSHDNPGSLPESKTLAKEIYMIKTVDLIPHSPLKQKMLFTKKMSSYELLKIVYVLVFIWTFFCISIALNVVLFKYADR